MQVSNFLLFCLPLKSWLPQFLSHTTSCRCSQPGSPGQQCPQYSLAQSKVLLGCAHQQSTKTSNQASHSSWRHGLGWARNKHSEDEWTTAWHLWCSRLYFRLQRELSTTNNYRIICLRRHLFLTFIASSVQVAYDPKHDHSCSFFYIPSRFLLFHGYICIYALSACLLWAQISLLLSNNPLLDTFLI